MSLFYIPDDYDPYKGLNDDERLKAGCFQTLLFMVMVFLTFLICSLFTSCKSHEPTIVERVRTDTVRITQQQRDSIYLHDSIYVFQQQRGDTILLTTDRWHTQYRDRWRTDTIYRSRTDTVVKTIVKQQQGNSAGTLTWWQQTRLYAANVLMGGMLIAIAVWLIRRRMRV